MLWWVFIIATIVGAFCGGSHALALARKGEFRQAGRTGRWAAFIAAVTGLVLTIPFLGWPYMEVSTSVAQEVSKTVVQTIEVPVKVTKWLFFNTTKTETRQVPREETQIVLHMEARQAFSFWLLFLMTGVGGLCYLLERWFLHLLWWGFG